MKTCTNFVEKNLRPALPGLLLAVLTLLFGFAMGIGFGLNEDLIKDHLKNSATEVRETIYKGDDAAIQKVQEKSWAYMKRAHLHAGGMGAAAIGLILVLAQLGLCPCITRVVSIALGAGGLGYSAFWMWAGLLAPSLGGTGAAKESLEWLAMLSSGSFVLATLAVAIAIFIAIIKRPIEEV